MKLRKNRVIEREAVNAVRSFFEANECVFQEVDTGNDYGKDAYVDFVNEGTVTGICFALQIKGGTSYKRGERYGIPLDNPHAEIWRSSTLPVIGIVYDPEDTQMRWCNISDFLDDLEDDLPSYIPVEADAILTPTVLHFNLKPTLAKFSGFHVEHPIIQICAKSEIVQLNAVYDCFGLGRSDARVLIALRYLLRLLTDDALHKVIPIVKTTKWEK